MRLRNTILGGAVWPGMTAGLLSAVALAWRGRVENAAAAAPLNAPSQWVWGTEARRHNRPTLRHTLTGLAVHQLASLFWGVVHARTAPLALSVGHASGPAVLRHAVAVTGLAAGVTTLAAVVDLALVPERLTPGFQRKLSARSLWYVYAAFAAGLAIGQVLQPESQRLPVAPSGGGAPRAPRTGAPNQDSVRAGGAGTDQRAPDVERGPALVAAAQHARHP